MLRPRRPRISADNDGERLLLTRERLSDYLRLLRYVRPYRSRMILAIIALTVGTLLGLVMPLVIRSVVDVTRGNFEILAQGEGQPIHEGQRVETGERTLRYRYARLHIV